MIFRFWCAALLIGFGTSAGAVAAQPVVTKVEFIGGQLLTYEGGTATPQQFVFQRPFGIDFDSSGTMYVVELEGGRVHRQQPDGSFQVVSGDGSRSYTGDGGEFAQATYNGMHNLAIDSHDRAFIADTFNHCLRLVDLKKGTIDTFSGSGEPGFAGDGEPARKARFDYLMSVSLSPQEDALYIADLKNHRIRKIDLKSGLTTTVAGNGKAGVPRDGSLATDSPLVDPRAVAMDSRGNLYILERNGHALRCVTPDGHIRTVAGNGRKGFQDGPALQAQLASPKHLCIDAHDRVIIADDANAAIRCYDPATETVSTLLGRGFGDPRIKLNQPHGVTIEKGQLYVCDTSNNRLFRLTFQQD